MEGIIVTIRTPFFQGPRKVIKDYSDSITGYTHTIGAVGGYKEATITLSAGQIDVEDWLENGLARDVIVTDESGGVIWEGFVDALSIRYGGRSIERGPVMDICNRLSIQYSPLNTSVSPPVAGKPTLLTAANNAASQALYGILQGVYSAGSVVTATASTLRDVLIGDLKDPVINQTLSLDSAAPSITLKCTGYYAYLNKYIYNNTGSGTATATNTILGVLALDPNALFSTDHSQIATNTLAIPVYDNQNRKAWDVLTSIASKGGAYLVRYLIGVYKDRVISYQQIQTTYEYQFRISTQELLTMGGARVSLYNVLPGRWLFYNDFLVGKALPGSALKSDPRSMFIESMTYTAPAGLSLEGSRVMRAPQILARMGLGGI
jgi:hypothetical protein